MRQEGAEHRHTNQGSRTEGAGEGRWGRGVEEGKTIAVPALRCYAVPSILPCDHKSSHISVFNHDVAKMILRAEPIDCCAHMFSHEIASRWPRRENSPPCITGIQKLCC